MEQQALSERSCMQQLLLCHDIVIVEGRVTISPHGMALVCDGGQLELNCTTTGSVLEWRIIPEQNHSQLSVQSYVPTRNQSFAYGDSTISFIRISHPMQLTSYRTVISPVGNSLNGTEVKCTDLMDLESSSTVISVVNAQGIISSISDLSKFNVQNTSVMLVRSMHAMCCMIR